MSGHLYLAALLGWLAGMLMGPLSFLIIVARNILREVGEEWPDITTNILLRTSFFSIPAAINGAIGAIYSAKYGTLERQPITILPVAIHVVTLPCLMDFTGSLWGNQMYVLTFTIVIWSAGRVGQRLGLLTRSIF